MNEQQEAVIRDIFSGENDDMTVAELRAKHAKLATLADYSDGVRWDMVYSEPDRTNWLRSKSINGINIDESGHYSTKYSLTPWPEIVGIDPRDLLNDGWQIRKWDDVPDEWEIMYAHPTPAPKNQPSSAPQ